MNGALAIADVLGIFGREGVDMAAYWSFPPPGSPGAHAFAVYTNYDGQGHGFGDQALTATSDHPDDVTSYASVDSTTGDLVIVSINKRSDVSVPTTLRLNTPVVGQVEIFRYTREGDIHDLGSTTMNSARWSWTFRSHPSRWCASIGGELAHGIAPCGAADAEGRRGARLVCFARPSASAARAPGRGAHGR